VDQSKPEPQSPDHSRPDATAEERATYMKPAVAVQREFVRFTRLQRTLHGSIVISFLSLAVTGLTLKFSYTGWAVFMSRLLGGFQTAGYIHRFAAVVMFAAFITHVVDLCKLKKRKYGSWRSLLLGPNSMIPMKRDLDEFIATLKWFVHLGPKPEYGRWTYWEKFDYFAVFWGVFIIGSTGLTLWFPVFFTRFLPGAFINVATIIHSDEALLATGFIFTVHFFNTHLRPEKFPMDTTVFTVRRVAAGQAQGIRRAGGQRRTGAASGRAAPGNRGPHNSRLCLDRAEHRFQHRCLDCLRHAVCLSVDFGAFFSSLLAGLVFRYD
jgi:cytochrome b subunit of formate dehydrogenase